MSKSSMFTPGPWAHVKHSWADVGIYAGSTQIALLSIEREATEENQDELEARQAADARLIAAAPELLAALLYLADCIESGRDPGMGRVHAAINKAFGEG